MSLNLDTLKGYKSRNIYESGKISFHVNLALGLHERFIISSSPVMSKYPSSGYGYVQEPENATL